jgi:hypothetical protein
MEGKSAMPSGSDDDAAQKTIPGSARRTIRRHPAPSLTFRVLEQTAWLCFGLPPNGSRQQKCPAAGAEGHIAGVPPGHPVRRK